jgi:acetyltransferase
MDLNKLFYPQSVAIVGASTRIGSVGNDVLKNLVQQGYKGSIYPINPKAQDLYGLKCLPKLSAIASPVDLAVIAIPALAVPTVLEEAGSVGVKAVIVISAGFKEAGNREGEEKIKEICQRYGMVLVGPNCLGLINPEIKLNASFAISDPAFGPVAFVSQSGALCTAVLDYAESLGIGFSKFVSVGNKAVLDEAEFFRYLRDDKKTRIIAMYTEQLSDTKEFMAATNALTKGPDPKPVIALKSGKTSAGASASASHTGALAGNDTAYDALFKQTGILRASSGEELFDLIQIFSNNALAPAKKVAVITNAGGPGVLATDTLVSSGLELASLSDKTKDALKNSLPPAANTHNPIDVLGDAKADRYQVALETVLLDDGVDAAIVILTPQTTTEFLETAEAIIAAKSHAKPLAAVFMGDKLVQGAVDRLRAASIAVYSFPEQAANALAAFSKFYESAQTPLSDFMDFSDINHERAARIFAKAAADGKKKFPEAEALEILEAYNFPLLKHVLVRSASEAATAAAFFKGNLAFKIFSQDILHKSDVGGIMLDVTPQEAGKRYKELVDRVAAKVPDAKIDGVLMMEMAPKGGLELILGSVKDPNLGSLIMAGLGGIYVEVFKDVSFALSPVRRGDAENLLQRLKAHKLIEGVRGGKALDKEETVEIICRLSRLLTDFPQIKELDINPLLVLEDGEGVKALDARIIIE